MGCHAARSWQIGASGPTAGSFPLPCADLAPCINTCTRAALVQRVSLQAAAEQLEALVRQLEAQRRLAEANLSPQRPGERAARGGGGVRGRARDMRHCGVLMCC